MRSAAPGEVIEFIAPVEDPDCVMCRLRPATRTLAILVGAEFGGGTVVNEHGHRCELGEVDVGQGGITEALAHMRKRAREKDQGPRE